MMELSLNSWSVKYANYEAIVYPVGEILVILEAMKMEHSIKASEDGVISELHVTKDDQVENGAILMVMDTGK